MNRLKKRTTVYSEIPIKAKPCQILIDYRKQATPGVWLFPSTEAEARHFTRKQAHNVLAQVFKTLKLEGAKTHNMRRTLLTTLSRAGVPLRTVQKIPGHSNLSQLRAYLEVDPEDKHKALSMLRY